MTDQPLTASIESEPFTPPKRPEMWLVVELYRTWWAVNDYDTEKRAHRECEDIRKEGRPAWVVKIPAEE